MTDSVETIALAIVGQHWIVLKAAPQEAILPILSSLSRVYDLPVEVLQAAHKASS